MTSADFLCFRPPTKSVLDYLNFERERCDLQFAGEICAKYVSESAVSVAGRRRRLGGTCGINYLADNLPAPS